MMKRTHIATAMLISIPLVVHNPVGLIGIIGSTAPDVDYKIGIEHRTITHSLLAAAISTLFIYFLNPKIYLVWGISYLSHLILDSFTKTGVPFLYPAVKKRYGPKLISTNSRNEKFILLLLIYLLISVFLKY